MNDRPVDTRPRAADLNRQAEQLIGRGQPGGAEAVLREALELAPDNAEAWNNLGRALNNLRRLPDAEAALLRAVTANPDLPQAWFNLAHVRRALGRPVDAEVACRRGLGMLPRPTAPALRLLASLRLMQSDAQHAIRLLHQALAVDPGDAIAYLELGDVLQGAERFDEAADAYRHCLSLAPGVAGALAGLGAICHARLELPDAESFFRQALAADPGQPVAVTGLAWALELQEQYEAALEHVRPLLIEDPPGWAVSTAGRCLRRLGRSAEARELLDDADFDAMPVADRTAALTVMGQIHDEAGEYERAFARFQAANACMPGSFDPGGLRRSVDRVIGFFTRPRLAELPASGCDAEQPVFVVGMPRSGTSLVEQILGRHPSIKPCGERRDIYRLPRRLSGGDTERHWPEILERTDRQVLAEIARDYLDSGLAGDPDCLRMIDKLPGNYVNLGLIQLLFPRARIIYCRRDPMDTGLSCFQQNFRSKGMEFARDLRHIGLRQQACWRLMEHWSEVLSLPIHVVEYEMLVGDPEGGSRRLLEFLGVPWDPACLDFHLSDRLVKTASYEQVKRPIYRSSVARWKNYAPWLAPLREALEAPWHG